MLDDFDFTPIDVTDDVEALSEEDKELAFWRTLEKLGIDKEDFDLDELEQDRAFLEEFAQQLKCLVVDGYISNLMMEGYVEPHGIDENGEVNFALTEKGRLEAKKRWGE